MGVLSVMGSNRTESCNGEPEPSKNISIYILTQVHTGDWAQAPGFAMVMAQVYGNMHALREVAENSLKNVRRMVSESFPDTLPVRIHTV